MLNSFICSFSLHFFFFCVLLSLLAQIQSMAIDACKCNQHFKPNTNKNEKFQLKATRKLWRRQFFRYTNHLWHGEGFGRGLKRTNILLFKSFGLKWNGIFYFCSGIRAPLFELLRTGNFVCHHIVVILPLFTYSLLMKWNGIVSWNHLNELIICLHGGFWPS